MAAKKVDETVIDAEAKVEDAKVEATAEAAPKKENLMKKVLAGAKAHWKELLIGTAITAGATVATGKVAFKKGFDKGMAEGVAQTVANAITDNVVDAIETAADVVDDVTNI